MPAVRSPFLAARRRPPRCVRAIYTSSVYLGRLLLPPVPVPLYNWPGDTVCWPHQDNSRKPKIESWYGLWRKVPCWIEYLTCEGMVEKKRTKSSLGLESMPRAATRVSPLYVAALGPGKPTQMGAFHPQLTPRPRLGRRRRNPPSKAKPPPELTCY